MAAPSLDRRRFLAQAGGGAGLLAFSALNATGTGGGFHFAPRAKQVIWLFMHGGPSQVDLFDPKPDLARYSGQPLPESFGAVMTRRDVAHNPLLGPLKPFRPRGQSGLMVSDFLPHLSELADELCVLRSVHGDSVNHPQSVYQMNTGQILTGRPSVGSWVSYGLGSDNQDLPAFLVLTDRGSGIKGGPPAWGSGFLPGRYQGVTLGAADAPILNLQPHQPLDRDSQRQRLDLLQRWNERHRAQRDGDDRLEARIAAHELALRMQAAAPELVDLRGETAATERLYGLDQPDTREFGLRCLLARRMVERGVRFVQLYSGDTNGWDAHQNVLDNHGTYCLRTDRPIAGLLRDLRQRGLLDETLVIWGGEFGRMPMSEQGTGRDHNPWGYSIWLAGAGIRGGRAVGATDAVGLRAQENPIHIRDLHATLLHLIGLDHERLSYFHHGLDERLTGPGNEARVVAEVLA